MPVSELEVVFKDTEIEPVIRLKSKNLLAAAPSCCFDSLIEEQEEQMAPAIAFLHVHEQFFQIAKDDGQSFQIVKDYKQFFQIVKDYVVHADKEALIAIFHDLQKTIKLWQENELCFTETF